MAAKKKPLRTLKEPIGPPDHFTLEEAHAAVLAVMAERGEVPRPDRSAKWLRRGPCAIQPLQPRG